MHFSYFYYFLVSCDDCCLSSDWTLCDAKTSFICLAGTTSHCATVPQCHCATLPATRHQENLAPTRSIYHYALKAFTSSVDIDTFWDFVALFRAFWCFLILFGYWLVLLDTFMVLLVTS